MSAQSYRSVYRLSVSTVTTYSLNRYNRYTVCQYPPARMAQKLRHQTLRASELTVLYALTAALTRHSHVVVDLRYPCDGAWIFRVRSTDCIQCHTYAVCGLSRAAPACTRACAHLLESVAVMACRTSALSNTQLYLLTPLLPHRPLTFGGTEREHLRSSTRQTCSR